MSALRLGFPLLFLGLGVIDPGMNWTNSVSGKRTQFIGTTGASYSCGNLRHRFQGEDSPAVEALYQYSRPIHSGKRRYL
jgi:hypothetical protein